MSWTYGVAFPQAKGEEMGDGSLPKLRTAAVCLPAIFTTTPHTQRDGEDAHVVSRDVQVAAELHVPLNRSPSAPTTPYPHATPVFPKRHRISR